MAEELLDEVQDAEFGDVRLSKRLTKIIEHLGGLPQSSIPGATAGRAEMEAAYRFFDNPKVSPAAISSPHRQATLERARQSDVVLLVQDTTELDVTRPSQQVTGAGPMACESRRGGFYHPLLAFSGAGLALGTVWSKNWCREKIESGRSSAEKERRKKSTPIEDKESMRWLAGLREARRVAELCPRSQCICIADSESDIYELFAEPRGAEPQPLELLIRACHDRVLLNSDEKLLSTARRAKLLYRCSVDVSSRKQKTNAQMSVRKQSRDARIAEVEVRAAMVTLQPPPRPDRTLPPIEINVVLVEETNPPAGQPPIQWLLLTTLPIIDPEQVKQIIQYYCVRWQIEIYFRTLKSGCRIQERYFQRMDRLLNCLAVYSIVAWRILYLCRLGRDCPDIDCEVVFSPSEWRAVYMTVRHREPPQTPPTLNEVIRMVASLGGYVIRAKTNPGTQTLWLGLQRLHDLSTAWNPFGPNSRDSTKNFLANTCQVR